jgi:uncharacterized protein YceK
MHKTFCTYIAILLFCSGCDTAVKQRQSEQTHATAPEANHKQIETAPKIEPEVTTLAMPVYSLRSIELLEGIDAASLEVFVKDEFKNAFSTPTHGIRAFIVKGDRGEAKGEYKIVVVFDSKKTRDKYFPIEDGDASKSLQEDATPNQVAVLEKLATLVKIGEYSDFAGIGE